MATTAYFYTACRRALAFLLALLQATRHRQAVLLRLALAQRAQRPVQPQPPLPLHHLPLQGLRAP